MPTEPPTVPPPPTPRSGDPGPDVSVSWGPVPRSAHPPQGPLPHGTVTTAPPGPHPGPVAGSPSGPAAQAGEKANARKRLVLQIALLGGAALLVVGLVVAIGLVLSGSGNERGDLTGFSGEPVDYVPNEVDGREVSTNAPVLEEIGDRFLTSRGMEGSNFDLVTAMLPSGPRQPPRVVLLVLGGEGADGLMSSFDGDSRVRSDSKVDISGETVRVVEVANDDFERVWTAIAAPRDDIALVAMSFGGERSDAESMIEAALETGRE